MKKIIPILITGAAGNIGSAMSNYLLSKNRNYLLVGVDNFLTGKKENLPTSDRFHFFKIDVNNYNSLKKLFNRYDFKYIFHYAACAGVERTIENPFLVFNDVDGINNIAKLSLNSKVKKIIFSSSSEVYGENAKTPFKESFTPINPRLPYATVKAYGESVFLALSHRYGINCNIFRFFNTYGPAQSADYVIKNFIIKAIRGEDLNIFGSGSQTRTFLYIQDNLDATYNAFLSSKFDNKPINIGSKKMYNIIELAKIIIKLCGSKSKIKILPKREIGDTLKRQPDDTIFKNLLGRNPLNLKSGILNIINEIK